MRVEIAHFGRVRRASSTSPWRGLRRVISAANTELSPPFQGAGCGVVICSARRSPRE
jgi:hypothetical protein